MFPFLFSVCLWTSGVAAPCSLPVWALQKPSLLCGMCFVLLWAAWSWDVGSHPWPEVTQCPSHAADVWWQSCPALPDEAWGAFNAVWTQLILGSRFLASGCYFESEPSQVNHRVIKVRRALWGHRVQALPQRCQFHPCPQVPHPLVREDLASFSSGS